MNLPLDKLNIVVADDSPIYRKLVATTLAQEQYALTFARNGREAASFLARHHPVIVVTDWEMPDMRHKPETDNKRLPTRRCRTVLD
jgi:CheY-like chemotaxis protein